LILLCACSAPIPICPKPNPVPDIIAIQQENRDLKIQLQQLNEENIKLSIICKNR